MKNIKITNKQLTEIKRVIKEENKLEKLTLPKFIINSIKQHKTSLGDHPSFPPGDERMFQEKLLLNRYNELGKSVAKIHGITDYSYDGLINRLNEDLVSALKIEKDIKPDLEKICLEYVVEKLGIVETDIDIECKLVDRIKLDFEPNIEPMPLMDSEFWDIEDINSMEKEVYKRRLIDSIVQGASTRLSSDVSDILHKIYEINPKLPELYYNIISINNFMTFVKEVIPTKENVSGFVTVNLSKGKPSIKSQGVLFPVLLFETFKGIFEFISSHGLPENMNDAEYVIGKSDFLLADSWDRRFGVGLWDSIVSKVGGDIKLMPQIFLELITLKPEEFNNNIKEIFANTKKGKEIILSMVDNINRNNEFGEIENSLIGNSDSSNDFFTPDELKSADVELITDSTTTSSIGDFTYDAPAFGDAESNDHTNMIAKGKADWNIR